MRLLVLGGTEFAGRALVGEAIARDWEVTVFNRGSRPAPAGVRALRGDRTADGGLDSLRTDEWDAVVDTWSWAPGAVRDSARLLADRVGRYAYISSRSVYAFPVQPGSDETAPVVEASPDAGRIDYARDKRGGELGAAAAFGDERSLFVRAGLILGPWEDIGRLPWWLGRIARGGEVLAPGPRELELQYVDVRDLARWVLDALEAELHGPYDLVSAPGHTTTGELLEACVSVTGSDAELRWASPEYLERAGIQPWTELPIWQPPGAVHAALHRADVSKALATGLSCRPVTETVRDTWAWLRSLDGAAPHRTDRPAVGVDPEVEAAALRALASG